MLDHRDYYQLYLREVSGYKNAVIRRIIGEDKLGVDLEFRKNSGDEVDNYGIWEVDYRDYNIWLRVKKLEKLIGNLT